MKTELLQWSGDDLIQMEISIIDSVTARRGTAGKWTLEITLQGELPLSEKLRPDFDTEQDGDVPDDPRVLVLEGKVARLRVPLKGRLPNPQWARMRKKDSRV